MQYLEETYIKSYLLLSEIEIYLDALFLLPSFLPAPFPFSSFLFSCLAALSRQPWFQML